MRNLKYLPVSLVLAIASISPLVLAQAPGYEPPRTEFDVSDFTGSLV